MIHSFDDALKDTLKAGNPAQFLFVFIKCYAMDDKTKDQMFPDRAADMAAFIEIALDAHQPVTPDMTFRSVVENADKHNADWDIIAIWQVTNRDGTSPSRKKANEGLAEMKKRIMSGDCDGMLFFDRDEKPTAPLDRSTVKGRGDTDKLH